MNAEPVAVNREREVHLWRGAMMLPVNIGLLLGAKAMIIYFIVSTVRSAVRSESQPPWWLLISGILLLVTSVIMMVGFFTLQPNEARVLLLFGRYKGTVRTSGFHWGNPFYANDACSAGPRGIKEAIEAQANKTPPPPRTGRGRHKISLRSRNLNGEKLKVNDKRGNPIEIAAVVVWRVQDTAQASFEVEDYENYVRVQSESAVRHLASAYAYDHGEDNEITLRSGMEEISHALRAELQERLGRAGVLVEEARLTHLAYAPEIAQVMLRRQQAEAIIAARQKIVTGAVSMVEMALKELAAKQVVQLDDERKAAMVSNLMVVLCSESEVHPVVNTGTLYS